MWKKAIVSLTIVLCGSAFGAMDMVCMNNCLSNGTDYGACESRCGGQQVQQPTPQQPIQPSPEYSPWHPNAPANPTPTPNINSQCVFDCIRQGGQQDVCLARCSQ